ncbi:MAG: gamma-glutamyltransferase [Anaerolineae bacterium]|nr:gamma-glutamyltransferase [Gemmatimonadaceae bacterium]
MDLELSVVAEKNGSTIREATRAPADAQRGRPLRGLLLLSAAILLACRPMVANGVFGSGGPSIPARRTPEFPTGWRFTTGERGVISRNAMVVSNSALASEAGAEIMRRGGNAIDAAVATGFALAVTYPVAGNIGGGGFMVIRMADGRVASIDYREVAPLASTRNMYIDPSGMRTDKSLVGHLASGVPGAVAGMAEALSKYGSMSLGDVIEPAIRLAGEGFVVDSSLWRSLTGDSALLTRFAGATTFYPGGRPIAPGSRLVQQDLARTLRLIAAQGPAAFYRGEVADLLVAEMQRGAGIITKEDLARYRPIWREPLRSSYRGYSLIAMPPASSGGTTMIESLNILETYASLPPFHSSAYKHLLAESFRRAFVDRNTKLCDPAFCNVPVAQLTSKSHAETLAQTIKSNQATRTSSMASIPAGTHTTHYSVVDAKGNAVATTTTLNGGYGSGVYVTGAGFFLNNEMDDLAVAPGQPNMFGLIEGEQNAVQPGKRPLSSMSPTIVLDPRGELLLVAGAAGGPTIITGTMQVILNVIEHRMSLADAMRAPRMHHQAWPDSIRFERNGFTAAVSDSLTAIGHGLYQTQALTNVNAIMRVRGGLEGVVEPRGSGGAVGY